MDFCVFCLQEVKARIEERQAVGSLKGREVSYKEKVAYCPICGEEIAVPKIMDENLKSFYKAYREQEKLISFEDIIKLSNLYSISKRNFALLLGWGEHTFERFCEGYIPSKQYSDEMIKLLNKEYFREKLVKYGEASLGIKTMRKVLESLDKIKYINSQKKCFGESNIYNNQLSLAA
jgi:putative zinc finger/helix-turn-helix YgiT family protein